MTRLRKTLLAASLLWTALSPLAAIAQAPPAVPALPDQERRTSYSITGSTCVCAINMQLYASGSDVDAWLQVWVNGVRYLSTDATYGWSLSSTTGPLSTIPRPITNAVLTFNSNVTGTVQITGAERPRQLSQFQENQGVPARALNQRMTEITAVERELWDKTSDLSGRGLFFAPGNTTGPMPQPSACINAYLTLGANGLTPQCVVGAAGTGNVNGPGTATINDVVLFGNNTGSAIIDAGGGVGSVVGAFPGPNDPAVGTGMNTGHILPWLDQNDVFSGNGVYPLIVAGSNPYVIGASPSTINNAVNGDTYCVTFTSTHLTGSPVKECYTATGVDTVSTVATNLCAVINAVPSLNTNGLPLICQAIGSGTFNLQWQASYSDMAVSSAASTGSLTLASPTETLDYAVNICGRRVSGYTGQNNDADCAIAFYGQSTDGTMDAELGIIEGYKITATAGGVTGNIDLGASYQGTLQQILAIGNGVSLFKSDGTLPTFQGVGTLALPSNGALWLGSGTAINSSGVFPPSSTVYGGAAAGSNLNLVSTQSGSPSGDYDALWAGGSLRVKVFSDGGVMIGAPSGTDEGAGTLNLAGLLYNNGVAPNASTGYVTQTQSTWTPAIAASGTAGTPAYTTQVGSYEKTGREVTLRFTLVLSGWSGSPTGNITITGLPVASANTANDFGHCFISDWALNSSSGQVSGIIAAGSSVITMLTSSSTASAALTATNAGTTPTLEGYCSYHT